MKKIIFIVVLLNIFVFDAQCQSRDVPPNAQPGKCYAKCMIPDTTTKTANWSTWEEVVCSPDITPRLVSDITNALKDKGYNVDINAKVMTKEIKSELSKYQKASNLPQGNLNIKTLDALGIRY